MIPNILFDEKIVLKELYELNWPDIELGGRLYKLSRNNILYLQMLCDKFGTVFNPKNDLYQVIMTLSEVCNEQNIKLYLYVDLTKCCINFGNSSKNILVKLTSTELNDLIKNVRPRYNEPNFYIDKIFNKLRK